ncbi:MAG: Rpn family recombination-promoting nuclease/putative transposase, partial [Chlamydiia bacterium]|nr:Rpn family recombination-promoting nuclease/putative transposase [Chlamydiia bacterium]
MIRINPRVDIAFKKIFGVEENKDLLISLINSIISEEDQVQDVTLLNPYNQQNFKSDKLSILDIKAVGCNGKHFNIEIQITDEGDYDKRALYYWAKVYTDQLKTAGEYSELSKVIGIHILNFNSINAEKYHNTFHITEKDSGMILKQSQKLEFCQSQRSRLNPLEAAPIQVDRCDADGVKDGDVGEGKNQFSRLFGYTYFEDLELHTVELKKFTDGLGKEFEALAEKVQTSLDLWTAFLTKHDLLTPNRLTGKLGSPELKKAIEVLKVMNFTDEEKEAYESHLKWLRIEANTLKKMGENSRKEGLMEGHKLGLKEGIEKGRLEEKSSIALMLLKQMLSEKQIA